MDLITGKKLSALERALAGACVIVPVVSGSMVRIAGKNANIAEKVSRLSEKQLFKKGAKAGITMCEDAKKEMDLLLREIRNVLEEDVDIKRLFAKSQNTGPQVEFAGVGKVSVGEVEKLVGKDVRWSRGESGSKTISDLSNKAVKHPMNDHMPARYAKQLQYMSKEGAEQYLNYKTFFNSNWTDEQVRAALNFGYKEALNSGVITGKYSFKYLGENVTVYLEDGILKTGYGDYVYTYDELVKLLGGE